MSNAIIAIIRTIVPFVVGWAVAQLARLGIPLEPAIEAEVVLTLSLLAGSLYYIAVAWLERRFSWFGWLLGVARNPVYPTQPQFAELHKAGPELAPPAAGHHRAIPPRLDL